MTPVVTPMSRLFVAWQDPDTRRFHPVALLDRTEGSYRFRYLKTAEALDGFEPFISFPEMHETYESPRLFALFANRLMSPRRPDYPRFLEDLGLDDTADDFELLSRSGSRATDSIEVFAEPTVSPDGRTLHAHWFVRGIRHQSGAEDAAAALCAGDDLALVPEPTNPVNADAILVVDRARRRLGWMPDYLVDTVHRLWAAVPDHDVRVVVERANPRDTPLRTRLLCRLDATIPVGFVPFDDPQFAPLAE